MFAKYIAFLVLICTLALALLVLKAPGYPVIGNDLKFQRIDGQLQTFAEHKGKPLLIAFWSPSCNICMHEVEDLNNLYQALNGGDHFELLAPSMVYDRPDQVLQAASIKGMQYPVYLDLNNEIAQAFGNIVATPTTFLFNSAGEIIYQHTGKLDFKLISQKLTQLME